MGSPMPPGELNFLFMSMQRTPDSTGTNPDPAPKPSARMVAILRAAHQLLDRPVVFEDALALRILGAAEQESLRSDPSQYNTPRLKGLRASVVVRSRLAEEEWARSKGCGVRQYVILGAGLDTFAYRNQDHGRSRIFEVDLPAMQQWKRDCLRVAGIKEPGSLTYLPVDFERATLAEGLVQAAFCRSEPAFFSWLGVTMYLEEGAVMNTLRFIASLAPGSGVVFDYGVLPALLSPMERSRMEFLAARAAKHGEGWKACFDPSSLVEALRSWGFDQVEDLGPERLNERYLSGRTDGLRKSGVSRLICARISVGNR
jgi:methyltransferase (TIGR00027 family)